MDFEKAFKIYQVNCDTNSFPNSCGKAGYYLCTGDAGEHDPVCFKKYLFCAQIARGYRCLEHPFSASGWADEIGD